jgi:hypothetical protein
MQHIVHYMYCLNGHYVTALTVLANWSRMEAMMAEQEHSELPKFCTTCGAPSIGECQHCKAPIKVRGRSSGRPAYCGGCGRPFPWTEKALSAAKDYTDELEQFSPEEKATLKATFDDLTSDTPRTPLAVSRFKKFMVKAGPVAQTAFLKMFEIVVTEGTKKMMGEP